MKMLSYNQIAEIYDDDMGRNVPGEDITFYVQQCSFAQAPILELGCGTGRITLPLVKSGLEVVGIDISLPMLQQLQRKATKQLSTVEQMRLHYCQMDMSACAFNAHFAFILCPYSAFTYLVDQSSQAKTLANIRSHLVPNGLFILDVFVPNQRIMMLPDDYIFHDYQRTLADGTVLKRTKTIQKTAISGINIINRHYYFLDSAGKEQKKITTTDRIRYYFPNELQNLLQNNGFEVIQVLGDFREQPCDENSGMAVMICRVPA
jgi:SAM-dependent methyltransferase